MATNWLLATDPTAAVDLRVGDFRGPGLPIGALRLGINLQKFRIELRKTAGAPNPTVDLELWEAGIFVATLANDVPITSETRQIVEVTWDAALLSDVSGADVELRIVATPGT